MLSIFLVAAFPQTAAQDPMPYVRAHRAGDAALVAGRLEEARAAFESCLELSPSNATVAYALACVSARASDVPSALVWFERAVQWGYRDAEVARWDEDLESLRGHPRFSDSCRAAEASEIESQAAGAPLVLYDLASDFSVTGIAPDPEGRWVIVGLSDGTLCRLDARDGSTLAAWTISDRPPGRLAPGTQGDEINVDPQVLRRVRAERAKLLAPDVWAVDVDRTGARVAVLDWEGTLHIADVSSPSERLTRQAFPGPKEEDVGERYHWPRGAVVEFSPDGERILVAGRERGASLWSVSGERLREWPDWVGGPNYYPGTCLAWSPDGSRIAMGDEKAVRFLDGATGIEVEPALPVGSAVSSLAFGPMGRYFATGCSGDDQLTIWDLDARSAVATPAYRGCIMPVEFNSIRFSPDGRFVAGGTGEPASVLVYDVPSGRCISLFENQCGAHFYEPFELHWSRDSGRLWCAYPCGGSKFAALLLDERLTPAPVYRGHAPQGGSKGLLFARVADSILALDPDTGCVRWNRVLLSDGKTLLATSGGYFEIDRARLDGIVILGETEEDSVPLLQQAERLFDPKRVRAARAGVPLAPVQF